MRIWILLGFAFASRSLFECGSKEDIECLFADCVPPDSGHAGVDTGRATEPERPPTSSDPLACEIEAQASGTTTVACSDGSTIELHSRDECDIFANEGGTSTFDCQGIIFGRLTTVFDCATTDNLDGTALLSCPGIAPTVASSGVVPASTCTVRDDLDSTFTVACTDGPHFRVDWRSFVEFATLAPGESVRLNHGLRDTHSRHEAHFGYEGIWRSSDQFASVFDPFVGTDLAFVGAGDDAELLGDHIPMTMLADGNAVVAWVSDPTPGAVYNVSVVQRDGAVVGSALDFASSSGNNSNTGIDVAALDGGGFVVGWSSWDASEVKLQRFDGVATPQGAAIDLAATRSALSLGEIAVAPLDDGGFAAAYYRNDGFERTVLVDEFSATGVFERNLETFTSVEGIHRFLNLIRPSPGRLLLARADSPEADPHIWLHWIDPTGVADPIGVDFGEASASEVSLSIDGNGNAIVGWEALDDTSPYTRGDPYLFKVAPDGTILARLYSVSHETATSVAMIGWDDGDFSAVWSIDGADDLTMQTFGPSGAARGAISTVTPRERPGSPKPLRAVLRWDDSEAWVSMKPSPSSAGSQILRIRRNVLAIDFDHGADSTMDEDNGVVLTNRGAETVQVVLTSMSSPQ